MVTTLCRVLALDDDALRAGSWRCSVALVALHGPRDLKQRRAEKTDVGPDRTADGTIALVAIRQLSPGPGAAGPRHGLPR